MTTYIRTVVSVILLCSSASAFAVDVDTLSLPWQVRDADIKRVTNDVGVVGRMYEHRNGGANKSLYLRTHYRIDTTVVFEGLNIDTTITSDEILVMPEKDVLRSMIPEGYAIRSMKYKFMTPFIFPGECVVKAYPIYADWVEGAGLIDQDSSYHSVGGCSYINRMTPTAKPAIPSTPATDIDWRDSGYVSAPKNQNPWGTCWCFSAISSVESAYVRTLTGSRSYNNENGTGADQTVAAVALDSTSIVVDTIPRWRRINISGYLAQRAYSVSGNDCGYAIVADSGSVTYKTTEAAASVAPRQWARVVTRNGGFYNEYSVRITAANIVDAVIKSSAPSTNFGNDSLAEITTGVKYLFRVDSLRQRIDAALITNDTLVSIVSLIDSHYVSAVTSRGASRVYGLYKTKFVEGEVTWSVWKAGFNWGGVGATSYDMLDLSEQQILSCGGFDYQNGGQFVQAFESCVNDSLLDERDFRYQYPMPPCPDVSLYTPQVRFGWFYSYSLLTADDAKKILRLGPFSIKHIWNDNFGTYAENSTNLSFLDSSSGAGATHATQLVGCKDDYVCDAGEGIGAWIIKNQYGTSWGAGGFAHVAYGSWLGFYGTTSYAYIFDTKNFPTPWLSSDFGSQFDSVVVSTGSTWYEINIPTDIAEGIRRGSIYGFKLVHSKTVSNSSRANWSFPSSEDSTNANRARIIVESAFVQTKLGKSSLSNTRLGR